MMKNSPLFSPQLRPLGWVILGVGIVLGHFVLYHDFRMELLSIGTEKSGIESFLSPKMNITDELALTLCIVGLIFVSFSKVKEEDEYTARLRLSALVWAISINYIFVIAGILINNFLIRDGIMDPWNLISESNWVIYTLFSPLAIFVLTFYSMLFLYRKGQTPRIMSFYKPQIVKGQQRIYFYLGMLLTVWCATIWILAIIENIWTLQFSSITENWLGIAWYLWPLSLLMWMFSRTKLEDEYIQQIRLISWHWAFYLHFAILLILTWFVYGWDYLTVIFMAMPLLPFLFLIIFTINKFRVKLA